MRRRQRFKAVRYRRTEHETSGYVRCDSAECRALLVLNLFRHIRWYRAGVSFIPAHVMLFLRNSFHPIEYRIERLLIRFIVRRSAQSKSLWTFAFAQHDHFKKLGTHVQFLRRMNRTKPSTVEHPEYLLLFFGCESPFENISLICLRGYLNARKTVRIIITVFTTILTVRQDQIAI